MADARVLGVVSGEDGAPRLAYLNESVPASAELLAEAAPAEPGEVFRLAARCEQSRCTHFDGGRCQLASRIVEGLAAVTDKLPPCIIRSTCRWYSQEGAQACFRCPQIVTLNVDASAALRAVAGSQPAS
jgi:hypothetical protein